MFHPFYSLPFNKDPIVYCYHLPSNYRKEVWELSKRKKEKEDKCPNKDRERRKEKKKESKIRATRILPKISNKGMCVFKQQK
jgi:hypothetical protein